MVLSRGHAAFSESRLRMVALTIDELRYGGEWSDVKSWSKGTSTRLLVMY
jgi:hypothetical protein